MASELRSIDELDKTLANAHKVLVCYSTPWAASENSLVEKHLERFRPQFPDIAFFTVNVDAVGGVADRERVLATPTVQGYFRGAPFGEGIGIDAAKIEDLLRELHFQPELES
ncbi:hypothetical protein DFQ26_000012 [Actinomortierella ambigua]|nr:hypothetical protein DFQ26_000012 [Actinomortierella ambigua]